MFEKFDMEQFKGLIEDNLNGCLDHLDDERKVRAVSRLTNAFLRAGFKSRADICECKAKDIHKKRGLGGYLAKIVVANIQGPYDDRKARADRLIEIDKHITRLTNEKEYLLKLEASSVNKKRD